MVQLDFKKVGVTGLDATGLDLQVFRAEIPGGWLLLKTWDGGSQTCITQVNDPDHKWVVMDALPSMLLETEASCETDADA